MSARASRHASRRVAEIVHASASAITTHAPGAVYLLDERGTAWGCDAVRARVSSKLVQWERKAVREMTTASRESYSLHTKPWPQFASGQLVHIGLSPAQSCAVSANRHPSQWRPSMGTRGMAAGRRDGDAQEVSHNDELSGMASRTWRVIKGVWTETGSVAQHAAHGPASKSASGRASGAAAAPESEQARATVARVLQLARPEQKILVMAVGCMLVTTPMTLIMPAAVGQLLDVAVSADTVLTPSAVAAMLLGVFAVQGVFMSGRDALLAIAGERIAARLRTHTFAAIMRQDMCFFDVSRTGELINRLSSDVAVVHKAVTSNVISALRGAGMALGGTAMMVHTCPKLALVSLLVLPLGGAVAVFIGRFIKRKQREVQNMLAATSTRAEQSFSNIRVVRTFAGEKREVGEYTRLMGETRELSTSIGIASSLLGSVIHVAANVSLAGVLGYGGTLVVAGELSVGMLTSFLLYSVYVGFNFGALSSVYGDLMQAVGAAERLFALMDRTPALPPYDAAMRGRTLEKFHGRVVLRDVSFSYPSRPDVKILRQLSLSLEPGQVLGLVGTSGSGKSTIGQLLSLLYKPSAGVIEFDGVDAQELDTSWVRSQVGVVQQEPALFACSIADNILYGRLDATDEEVEAAARVANAHSFISACPDGYNTFVGERGVQLSGGQRQRIAIARAILKNPALLILDEATSALDTESEELVQQALDRVSDGRTVIKIAHRLNTIVNSDLIAVLHEGQVVEIGNAQQLLSDREGFFHNLFHNQSNCSNPS